MDMISKVKDMVSSSRAELHKTIQNIERKFEEFAHQIRQDIDNTEKSMDVQFGKYLEDNPHIIDLIRECQTAKTKEVIQLRQDTDYQLEKAKKNFDSKIADVDKNVEIALEKLTNFYLETQQGVEEIIEANRSDPVAVTTRLSLQVEPMQKKFVLLRDEVAKTLKSNYEKSQSILKDLENDVNNIESKMKRNYTTIIQKFKNCVDGKLK